MRERDREVFISVISAVVFYTECFYFDSYKIL